MTDKPEDSTAEPKPTAKDNLIASLEKLEDKHTPAIQNQMSGEWMSVNELIGHIRDETPLGKKMLQSDQSLRQRYGTQGSEGPAR